MGEKFLGMKWEIKTWVPRRSNIFLSEETSSSHMIKFLFFYVKEKLTEFINFIKIVP